MTYTKIPKNPLTFECLKCSYICCNKKDFNKHTSTDKHKILTGYLQNTYKKSQKIPIAFECDCGKVYKHRQSLNNHKPKCSEKSQNLDKSQEIKLCDDSKPIDYKNLLLKSMEQNNELMNLLISKNNQTDELINQNKEMQQTMQKTIQDIVPKIGNNNTTTNNNNQFNLQVFLNEDCKDAINFSDFIKQIQVSFKDIENQVESGYVKGISKLFIESLQGLGTNKRPIHCTDKKRKTLYIKENDAWDKEGSQDMLIKGINEVTKRTMQTLMKEKENQSEEYADMDSEFSMKCLSIQRNLFPSAPRETTINKVVENITKNSGIIE